jgi:hypothetical protein
MCAGVGADAGEFALQDRADQLGELVRLFTDRSAGPDSGGGDGEIVEGQRFRARIAEFDALRLRPACRPSWGFWHVERNEIDTGISLAQQQHRITRQAIKSRNDQPGLVATAGIQRCWAVLVALAAFDLDDFVDQFPAAAVQPCGDRCALRFEA